MKTTLLGVVGLLVVAPQAFADAPSSPAAADIFVPDAVTLHVKAEAFEGVADSATALFTPEVLMEALAVNNPVLPIAGFDTTTKAIHYEGIQTAIEFGDDWLGFTVELSDVDMTSTIHTVVDFDQDASFDAIRAEGRFEIRVVGDDLMVEPIFAQVDLIAPDFAYVPDFSFVESTVAYIVKGDLREHLVTAMPQHLEATFHELEASVSTTLGGYTVAPSARVSGIALDPTGVTTTVDLGLTYGPFLD